MSYVIAHPAGAKKPCLFKIKRSGTQMVGVVPDHTQFGEAATVVIKPGDIIVNLGDNPPTGTVYNVLVEPIQERLIAKQYGEVYSYVELIEPVRTRVMRAFPAALQRVKALGPACDWDVRTEIRNPKGLETGHYFYKPNASDVLILRPQQGQDGRQIVKVLAHEWAHGIWARHMDASARSIWIELFDRYVRVEAVSPRDIQVILRAMRQEGDVRAFIKNATPEEQKASDMYIKWLKGVHEMSLREMNDMVVAGKQLPIPDTHIHKSDTQTPITIYSKSSAPELFAEALACKVVGDLSDRRIDSMLRSLR